MNMLPAVLSGAIAGTAAGSLHFLSLKWVVTRMLQGRPAAAVLLQLVRLAWLAVLLLPIVRLGAWPLLAALVGILAARAVLLRRSSAA